MGLVLNIMKYFENLPKTNFESSIGQFSISNFFTYIDVSNASLQTSPIFVDSKTTLLEASFTVYSDVNSFWMFVLANNTINPFTLLSQNSSLFTKENEDKTNLEIVGDISGTTAYVFPQGSIILPYVSNTGGSYDYSSVGNFDINGPLSIIESAYYSNDTMVIKDQRGSTYSFILQDGNIGSPIVIISPTTGGTYTIQKQYYPTKTKSATKEIVKVEVSDVGYIEEIVSPVSPTKSKTKTKTPTMLPSVLPGSTGTQVTALSYIQQQSKNINAYLFEEAGVLRGLYVTTKYL